MVKQMLTPLETARLAVVTLDGKKARDIKVLEMTDLTVLADYFIICTAGSTTQIKTLADEVDKALRESGASALRVEGYRSGGWVLVDFGSVVVHIFLQEIREFYALERLWRDAKEVDIAPWIGAPGETPVGDRGLVR